MSYEFKFEAFWENRSFIFEGIIMTLTITVIALAIGLVVGLIAGLCKNSKGTVGPRWLPDGC